MEPLTNLEELRRHIAVLASVEETEAPFVSCYLNLEQDAASYRKVLANRALALRYSLEDGARADFNAAIGQIESYLAAKLRPDARGIAVFSRQFHGGAFFLPMQFAAPLPDWLAIYPTPNLFHLMELKDIQGSRRRCCRCFCSIHYVRGER